MAPVDNPNPTRASRSAAAAVDAAELPRATAPAAPIVPVAAAVPVAAVAAPAAAAAAPAVAAMAVAHATAPPAPVFQPVRSTGLMQSAAARKRSAAAVRDDPGWRCVTIIDEKDGHQPLWRCLGCGKERSAVLCLSESAIRLLMQ